VGALEAALRAVIAAEPAESKIQNAVRTGAIAQRWPGEQLQAALEAGIVSAEEASRIERAARLRRKVIMVDDFPRDLGRSELFQTTEPVSFEPLQRAFEAARAGTPA
jgi:acyl-CoA dehydrogenase